MRGLTGVSGVGPGVAGPQEQQATVPRPAARQRGFRGLSADAGQPECGGRVGGVAVAQGPHPLPTPKVSACGSGAGRRASRPQTKLSESAQMVPVFHLYVPRASVVQHKLTASSVVFQGSSSILVVMVILLNIGVAILFIHFFI